MARHLCYLLVILNMTFRAKIIIDFLANFDLQFIIIYRPRFLNLNLNHKLLPFQSFTLRFLRPILNTQNIYAVTIL